MPPWAPGRDVFQTLAEKAITALNPVLQRYVAGSDVYVSDVPGMELVADGVDPRALALLDGFHDVPRASVMMGAQASPSQAFVERDDSHEGGTRGPGRIFVYALNVVRLAGNFDAIEREITLALEREITATFLEGDRLQRELN